MIDSLHRAQYAGRSRAIGQARVFRKLCSLRCSKRLRPSGVRPKPGRCDWVVREMAVEGSTSAVSTGNQKYDRQIRIWGEHGQACLERSSVCVLHAGPTGTETLKNLVLPGIGSFTIVDGTAVDVGERGSNFFLTNDRENGGTQLNRAALATKSLLELNDRVSGSYIPHDPSSFLSTAREAASFFHGFSIVVVTQMGTATSGMQIIAEGCWEAKVPLLIVRSYGLVGSIRVQIPEISVLDAHEDSASPDLRLYSPFPALSDFVDSIDLQSIEDSTEAAHIPFVVILVKALAEFRRRSPSQLPSSRAEKDLFVRIVKELRPSACPADAENFEEALKYSNLRLCYSGSEALSPEVSRVLADPKSDPSADSYVREQALSDIGVHELPTPVWVSGRSTGLSQTAASDSLREQEASFWVHAAGVRAFLESNGGQLPVAGPVPDMTADTVSYVALQKLFARKAEEDAGQVYKCCLEVAERRKEPSRFDEASVRDFCKRLGGVRVLRYRSVADECGDFAGSKYLESVEMSNASDASNRNTACSYYALLRAVDYFHNDHSRYPGTAKQAAEEDLRLFQDAVNKVKTEFGGPLASPSLWCDEAEEVFRFANAELHNVASFLGGVAAQEVVKILTRQFVPLNNTLIVNFANLTSVAFEA